MDLGDASDEGQSLASEAERLEEPALVRKLARYAPLGRGDRQALCRALSLDIRHVRSRSVLEDGNGRSRKLAIMLSGWACCYRHLEDGRHQLVAMYLPGDVCDLHILAVSRPATTIILMPSARIARLSQKALTALNAEHPTIGRLLWLDAQVASSIEREWLVSLAQRSARERVAHLLCELVWRVEAVGQLRANRIDLPITQQEFAGACGLTPAHANRKLRGLHEDGLASWSDHSVTVHDRAALTRVAGFSALYMSPTQLG